MTDGQKEGFFMTEPLICPRCSAVVYPSPAAVAVHEQECKEAVNEHGE